MNESVTDKIPEPKRVGVWAEGTHIEAKEYVIPKSLSDSVDDIPTIPDIDDLQDMLEKELTITHVPVQKDKETVNALTEVSGGIPGAADSVEAVVEILNSYIPQEEADESDTVWTIDSLLTQLQEECQENIWDFETFKT